MSYLKSLLTGLFVSLTTVAAMAFPTVKVTYPTPGSTLDDKSYFESINITAPGCTVKDGAVAILEHTEYGEVYESTMFKVFMGSILVKFEPEDIIDNGEYELIIPAGSLICGDETNEELVYTYTLNDPTLGSASNYPQITLVSANPADGSKLAEFGGSAMTKISFVTSDDDAVNYIAWELWDVTDEENPEYVRQGNENRYDLNRNGNNDDAWADGLYVSVGGEPEKLVRGHKYKLALTFAGIGYEPATNQYPRPDQIAASTELTTAIYYEGLTEAPEYSEYTYVSVSPDPESYEIETANGAMFTVTYSGPVKPTSFNYSRAQNDVANAGTWAALGEVDANGCATQWEFTFTPEVIEGAVGTIFTTIQTKDKDGLYVKGNGGYLFNDYNYGMSWTCNVGAPDLTLVSPAEGATLESLSEIVVSNSENSVMALSYNGGKARILNMQGGEIRVLDDAVAVEGEDTQMKWTFEPITEEGKYTIEIPKYYFSIGEEMNGFSSKETFFYFFVEGNSSETGATFDLEPETVTPADYSTVTELSTITTTFADVTFCNWDEVVKVIKADGQGTEQVATATCSEEDDFFNPKGHTFTLDNTITEAGVYLVVFPKAFFYDETYDNEMGEAGHASEELIYTYYIKGDEPDVPVPGATFDIEPATVTPADGSTVTDLSTVELTFADVTVCSWDDVVKVVKVDGQDTVEVTTASCSEEDDFFNPTKHAFTFGKPITEDGTYLVIFPKAFFYDETYANEMGEAGHASPELTYTYVVASGQVGIKDIVAEDGTITVYNLRGQQVLENASAASFDSLAKGLYIINGVKVIKK